MNYTPKQSLSTFLHFVAYDKSADFDFDFVSFNSFLTLTAAGAKW